MNIESILLIVLMAAVAYLYYDRFLTGREKLPKLEVGERFATVKDGESNLKIKRHGVDTIVVDEEGNEIPIQKTRN